MRPWHIAAIGQLIGVTASGPTMEDPPNSGDIRDTYNEIGDHFAETRNRPWKQVATFLQSFGHQQCGIDIGCGNGRHLPLLEETCSSVIGIDISRVLLAHAATNDGTNRSLILGDASTMPIRSERVDLALSIATIHHLPSPSARRAGFNEINRILKSDGAVLLSTWSVNHSKFAHRSPGDYFVPWTLPDGTVVDRYYHLFDAASLETELKNSKLQIDQVWEENGNCWARCHRSG